MTKELVERLRYVVENPSAWEVGFDQHISDLINEAAARIAELDREYLSASQDAMNLAGKLNAAEAEIAKLLNGERKG